MDPLTLLVIIIPISISLSLALSSLSPFSFGKGSNLEAPKPYKGTIPSSHRIDCEYRYIDHVRSKLKKEDFDVLTESDLYALLYPSPVFNSREKVNSVLNKLKRKDLDAVSYYSTKTQPHYQPRGYLA